MAMAKHKRHRGRTEQQTADRMAALDAYQRHFGSTTQREAAAADMGLDFATFRQLLEGARRLGFDIEARP
jgi:arginine utilization protein RocB